MEEAILALNLEKARSLCKAMREEGVTAEVTRMKFDNSLHKMAFEVALADESTLYEKLQKLLDFVFQSAKEDLCSRSVTVAVIQDVFDVIPIERCEKIFSIVENNLPLWKSNHFFESCRNLVLRMCNDLLKRLSRTVNTSFCGQILVLLAHALPLCEKSGLNLASRFNTDNVTKYETEQVSKEAELVSADGEEMETGEIKENRDAPIDYALYVKFWQLQSFFSSPLSCYEKTKWRTFQHNTAEVLDMLESHKLERSVDDDDDDMPKRKSKKEVTAEILNSSITTGSSENPKVDVINEGYNKSDSFVAKYLTSQKLLQLQLNDSQFRRYFLVQCLILYQYLLTDVKFRDKSCILNDEQVRFIIESTGKCYQLLREAHPRGEDFAETIKKILEREKEWSEWKNKGCFDFTTLADKEKMSVFKRRLKARHDTTKVDLGNPELTKLWNINPDMLSACQDRKRKFASSVADFIRDPLDELDPDQQVEDQYKSINNEAFQWRATRLLMYHSPAYFQLPSKRNEVISAIGPFLEEVLKQTASITSSSSHGNGIVSEAKIATADNVVFSDKTPGIHENGKEQEQSPQISSYLVKDLSPLLAKDWLVLADALNIDKSKYDGVEAIEATKLILNEWRKSDGSSATVKKFGSVLLNAGVFTEQIGAILKKASSKEVPAL